MNLPLLRWKIRPKISLDGQKKTIKYQDDTALLILTLGYKVTCYAEIKREESATDFVGVAQVNNFTNSFKDE